ncbi:Nn.00g045650.m01.CDS01 [Neocucurbitaria sp. VM-36]
MSNSNPIAEPASSTHLDAVVSDTASVIERAIPTPQGRKKNTVQDAAQGDQEGHISDMKATSTAEAEESEAAGKEEDSELSEVEEDSTVGRNVRQRPISEKETFAPHPTDPTKIVATVRIRRSDNGGDFVQIDEIPELRVVPTTSVGTETKFIFYPPLVESKVPRQSRKTKNKPKGTWIKDTSVEQWTRKIGDKIETFKLTIIFRRFNVITHKYEAVYVSENKLENADPNDKKWMYNYNKWIDQIKRRRDSTYVQVIHRTHWTIPEKRALYTAINDFCRELGLFRFGFGKEAEMNTEDMQRLADAVNRVGGNNRNTDSVRSQIISAHADKNNEIRELLMRAEALRAKRQENKNLELPQLEEFPTHAISLSAFPTEEPEVKVKNKKGKKSKADARPAKPLKKRNGKASSANDEEDSHDEDSSKASFFSSVPSRKVRKAATTAKAGATSLQARKKRNRTSAVEESNKENLRESEFGNDEKDGDMRDEKNESFKRHDDSNDDTASELSSPPPTPPKKQISHKRKRPAASNDDQTLEQSWEDQKEFTSGNEDGELTRAKKKARLGDVALARPTTIIDDDGDSDMSDAPSC